MAVCATFVALALSTGCSKEYSQETPEALIDTARQMVVDGNTRRLSELVWAETEGQQLVIDRFGRTLDQLQGLGEAIADEFPQEVASIRARADEAAESGEINSLIGRALTASGGVARGAPDAVRDNDRLREGLDNVVRELLADPYGWLERNGDKLQPVYITDDIVALSWQDKPIVGLSLTQQDEKWYVKLPLDNPAVQRFLPTDSDAIFEIMAELVGSVHNVIADLADEVRAGEHRDLESVAATAGEYIAPTALMVMVAYGKALEERAEERRAAREAARAAEQESGEG